MLRVLGTALITAVVTSIFWVWFYSFAGGFGSSAKVNPAGDKVTVNVPGSAPVVIAEGLEVGPAGLAIPVAGIKANQLTDTYTQARAGGARRHDAIDIMAPEGTPVVAAADGTVDKLFTSAQGGLTLYVRSRDRRWSYYYAHLQRYEPGLTEGQQVKRGQRLGLVGHTGNANPAGPHLHFAINQMQPGEKWWDGAPINPYPLLAGKRARG